MTPLAVNGPLRRLTKRLLAGLPVNAYIRLRALAAAWDIRTGAWSEPELALIHYAVRPGETAIDVGANFGLWSYHLARAVGPTGRVYAFEPVPYTYAVLATTLRVLGCRSVRALPFACGATNGAVTLRVPMQSCGIPAAGQTCDARRQDERPGRDQHARHRQSEEIPVVQIALAGVLEDVEVSFVKADIEGAELFAFGGMTGIFAQHHPTVVCEINPWFLEGFGLDVHDLLGFFYERDYDVRRLVNGRLLPWCGRRVEEDNYVFIHPTRLDRFAECPR